LPGPASLDEGHHLPFVILRTTRDDNFSPIGMIGDDGFEGRSVPQVERVDRLDVIMPVKKHMRLTGPFGVTGLGHDGGVARRGPHFGGKTDRGDVLGQMISRGLAILGKGRIGRDRFDPQQSE
jgi:hypothetical protein